MILLSTGGIDIKSKQKFKAIQTRRIFHMPGRAGLLTVRLKFMTFAETSERTNVLVALRDQPNTGADASDELIRFRD
jgi:hypothetical protein